MSDGKGTYPKIPRPVCYWPLNGGGTDATGNGYDLAQFPGITYSVGKFGKMLLSYGFSSLHVGQPMGLRTIRHTPMSVAFWVPNININAGSFRGFYLTDSTPPSPVRVLTAVNYNSGTGAMNVSTNYGGAATNLVLSNAALRQYHVASTNDGTTLRLYIDGVEVNRVSMAGASGSFLVDDAVVVTGGGIEDVGVWNCRLSPEDVARIAVGDVPISGLL